MERLRRVIKRGLNAFKLEMKKHYNVDYSLSEVVTIKNNSLCRIIGNTPNNIFFQEITQQEINIINDKMLNSQKYSNLYRNKYSLNEKILLQTNFILSNNTIKRKSKKNGIYSIPAEITKINSYHSYKVKVANNY